MTTIPEQLSLFEENIRSRNIEEIGQIAHKIKTNFHWMGLQSISEKLDDIEKCALDSNVDFDELSQTLTVMREALVSIKKEDQKVKEFLSQKIEQDQD
jgi:HPt (histidine-containing phosphotransfer) domain-containing protein